LPARSGPFERRAAEPRRHPLTSIGNAVVTAAFFIVIGIPVLLAIYALQVAVGVPFGAGRGKTSLIDQPVEQFDRPFK
jgi:hypothetical protein